MNAEAKKRYFQELTLNLRHEGFTVKPETEDGLLPVELNGRRLCLALDTGGVRYRREDVSGDVRSEALEQVLDIAKITGEYMSQMETAPQLTAASLEGDYRLLTDFNGVVLAGHPTQFGVQFITWERVQNRTALHQENYYGPSDGAGSYTAAKQGFAVRSGLIPRSALFTPEQLAETYRCIRETLESACPITDEWQKCLESAAEQIEHGVPDLAARAALSNQREMELRQMGDPRSPEELAEVLYRRILPHQNRGSLQRRPAELAAQFQGVLEKASAPGIRDESEKRELADSWLELAVSFAKVPVKYEADILKQQQKQTQQPIQQEMG